MQSAQLGPSCCLGSFPGFSSTQPPHTGGQQRDQGQEARVDLFCTFLWGVGLHPLISQPLISHSTELPGLGLASPGPRLKMSSELGTSGDSVITTTKNLTQAGSDPGLTEKTKEERHLSWGSWQDTGLK